MPNDPAALARIAALMDAPDWSPLEDETRAHMTAVRRVAGPDLDGRPQPHAAAGAVAALPDPERADAIVRGWFSGRLRAVKSGRARAALERLSADVLARVAEAPDPMHALLTFDKFLHGLPAGAQLLALIEANPWLLDLLTEICAAAPRLADHLARRASVLDAVLDSDFFAAPPPLETMIADLETATRAVEDFERRLDAARRWAAERRFQIGVLLLRGDLPAEAAGRAYADVAEACLVALIPAVEAEQAARHGPPPGEGAAVAALGRLGSREMTASSDLDLIVIYDADPVLESAGPRPLPAAQYYARFTQRLVAALTAPTAEGALYDVDLRLRPSGRSGPLATSLSGFERYQREDAWVWEHLALTRARAVAGPAELCERVETAIAAALRRPRAPSEIREEALAMRAKLAAANPAAAAPWAVKHTPGGLFDIEFIAQVMLLETGSARRGGWSAATAFEHLAEVGAIERNAASELIEAYRLQVALLQIERVALEGRFEPDAVADAVRRAFLRATGSADFDALTARVLGAQRAAAAAFEQRIGPRR